MMHLQGAVNRLDRDRFASFVVNEEMRAGDHALRAAETRRWCRHHDDLLQALSHLVDGGKVGEHPEAELVRGDGRLEFSLVTGVKEA